jgi:hypothetical protein
VRQGQEFIVTKLDNLEVTELSRHVMPDFRRASVEPLHSKHRIDTWSYHHFLNTAPVLKNVVPLERRVSELLADERLNNPRFVAFNPGFPQWHIEQVCFHFFVSN